MPYVYLLVAIVAEVIGTSALKLSDGFSKPMPVLAVICGYGVSFYCLSVVLKFIPVGVAYAIWSGVGIILVAIIGWVWFRQALDWPAMAGMVLIITGILVMNLLSSSVSH